LLLDLIENWSLMKHPWMELFKLMLNILFSFLVGTLPNIDNFAHVGGFVSGLFAGILFMPKIYFGKWDKRRKLIFMALSVPALVVFVVLTLKSFYDGANTCSWCKYFNCIPGMPWCEQKFSVITSINTTVT
jgi:membrane associated rhomboid family serine protease